MSETKYKYFTNGVWPIRATIGDTGTFIGTETPNYTTGELKIDMKWIDEVTEDRSGDVIEITKEEFDGACTAFLSEKKTKPPIPNGMR